MFLTKLKMTAVVLLMAGVLVATTAGVLAQQRAGPTAATQGDARQNIASEAARAVTRVETGEAPAKIKQSRKTLIARLEVERETAKYRLDLLTEKAESPDDPALVQARTTLLFLDALLARIDAVLVEAAKSYPATVEFGARAQDEWAKALSAWVDHPEALPKRAEETLKTQAEWAEAMLRKGYLSQPQAKLERARYEAVKQARLGDMARAKAILTEGWLARAKERVAWAEEMFKKGYVAKSELDKARKEYEDLKARQGFERPASPTPNR